MKKSKYPAIFMILLITAVFLSSCNYRNDKQEVKFYLENERAKSFAVCWPEDSPLGIYITKIINNYNLITEDKDHIKPIFYENPQDYLADLRAETATKSLPDYFIISNELQFSFLYNSSKVQILSEMQTNEKNDGKIYESYLRNKNGEIIGYYITQPKVRLLVKDEFIPKNAVFTNMIALEEHILEQNNAIQNSVLSSPVYEDSPGFYNCVNYFFYLLDIVDGSVSFQEILELWKKTLPLLSSEQNYLNQIKIDSPLFFGFTGFYEEKEEYTDSEQLIDSLPKVYGPKYYLAAAGSKEQQKSKSGSGFLSFAINYMKYPVEIYPESGDLTLQTGNLSLRDFDELTETLLLYCNNAIDAATCTSKIYTMIYGFQ